jgi:hypothetical protein
MKKKRLSLNTLIAGIVTLLLFTSFVSNPKVEPTATYDSIIVVQISDITPMMYSEIEAAVLPNDKLNIDYSCLWSGVLILKLFDSPLYDRGDIHMFAKSIFSKVPTLGKVEILHIYTGLAGSSAKC